VYNKNAFEFWHARTRFTRGEIISIRYNRIQSRKFSKDIEFFYFKFRYAITPRAVSRTRRVRIVYFSDNRRRFRCFSSSITNSYGVRKTRRLTGRAVRKRSDRGPGMPWKRATFLDVSGARKTESLTVSRGPRGKYESTNVRGQSCLWFFERVVETAAVDFPSRSPFPPSSREKKLARRNLFIKRRRRRRLYGVFFKSDIYVHLPAT